MAAPAVKNPLAPAESKAAANKKKKAKGERTESPAPTGIQTPDKPASVAALDPNAEDSSENPHIREIQKTIRNITKKITNSAKTDSLIAENAGKSLDDLVNLKIINTDQKAQHLKKPQLQAQLFQLEEQLKNYREIEKDHRNRLAEAEKALTEKFEKEKADLVSELQDKAKAQGTQSLTENLLVLSQFLRLAAARRAEENVDANADENLALEGVLLHIYSGDENAVATMVKLVQGSDEPTVNTSGETLATTYAQVKEAAIAHSSPLYPSEVAPESEATESKPVAETDPTVAHAGLTEIDDATATALTNGHSSEHPAGNPSANMDVDDGAANAAGESQWNDMSMSQEWVNVSHEQTEAEAPAAAAAAPAPAASNTQSWADDQPDTPTEATSAAPVDPNDGFQSVQRNRGNREGWRGRGGYRGDGRGRGGYRGDGRGRGRGGSRGGMPSRGPRRGGAEP